MRGVQRTGHELLRQTVAAHPRAVSETRGSVDDLLRFERLMSELSARFITLPVSQIDAVIEGALRRVVELLRIDRSSLTRLVADTGELRTTHTWAVPGLPPAIGATWHADDFEYLVALGRSGKPLVFERLAELPPAAHRAKAAYERSGLLSHVAQPLLVDGELVGFLGFGSLRRERSWPDDLVARMRVLADIFASALARKRAQEQVAQSELRLDAIVRSAMDAIVTVDADQRIILFNAAAERMFGCSASQAIGTPLDRFMPGRRFKPTGAADFDGPGSAVVAARPTAVYEGRALRADGTGFPIEASIARATFDGRDVVTVILRDVTDRVTAATEIERALGFERLLADLSASMLAAPSLDVARIIPDALRAIGEFLLVDRVSLWRLATRDAGSLLLHTWCAAGVWAGPRALESVEVPWLTRRLLQGDVVRIASLDELPAEAAMEREASRRLGIRCLLAVPLRVEGRSTAALSLAMLGAERAWPDALIPRVKLIGEALANLLERDRKARQLAAAQTEAAQFRDRLAHLVRVHTVGEMSAALAHEITQPLGAIENYALAARSRASEGSPDLAKVVELLDKVVGQATRAGDVVTRLRGLVKRHDLEPAELDLGRAVHACVDLVRTECNLRDIRIDVQLDKGLPPIVADEIQVQQVIINLLRNSMEAMPLERPGATREITMEAGTDGVETVFVRVADRGVGIPEGELAHVFESFYSTKPTGLGIGLAICRKLIEAHGGALWAEHRPGGGAVFQFTLPVRAGE